MLNQVVLTGRMGDFIKENRFIVNIPRPYKNENGDYDVDKIEAYTTEDTLGSAKGYIHKGDIVGIKGRLENLEGSMILKVEKITFLSASK